MNQKTIRKVIVGLHILSLVLVGILFLLRRIETNEGIALALSILLIVGILTDVGFLIAYFRLSKELESDLSRSQVELLQQQLQSNEDKLNALQSQINPHFLYNTLEMIREMALEHDDAELSRMISSLSLMFRYSMDFSNTVVPLEHELAQVRRYMRLQQNRFPDRFELNIIRECDEDDFQNVTIPKFSVQPLAENAVMHGFHNMRTGCVLNLRMSVFGDTFKIAVEDNGKGIDPEEVQKMNQTIRFGKTERDEGSVHNGIGLHNIYSRLRLYFGEQVSMYVYSSVGIGTIVTIDFPIKKNV